MDKELTIQDLEAQADALLAAADEMEELLPADTGKSKRKKAEDEAPAEPTTKVCPYCQSEIAIKAVRCPHCTSKLEGFPEIND